ncbi:MAG: DNA polymerase I, partial [Pseudomonadales bacterium]|nr:DNA polymerase I [Pseudomonadales bacterium]
MANPTDSAPVILVDGSSYLFRAFHALPPLITSKGQPSGAIKGVINMIRRLQQDYPASKIIIVFDAKGKNFRHTLYSDYKANRPPMPEELRSQIQPIHEIITAMGLPLLVIPEVEADDVIGTLAHEATTSGIETIISTGDKDMAQLVSEHVTLINTMDSSTLDKPGVISKFGVPAERIIDYLALMGDKVDNIPGVPKCGPKTAVKWLEQFGSLKGVMENADQVKGKIGENLRDSLEFLPLSYELATIKTTVELPKTLADIQPGEPDKAKLLDLFKELEFKTWIRELDNAGSEGNQDTSPGSTTDDENASLLDMSGIEYETILTQSAFDEWLGLLAAAPWFAFDTETTSLDYMAAEIVGVSFALEPGKAAYVPVAHDYLGAPEQLSRSAVLEALKPLLEA